MDTLTYEAAACVPFNGPDDATRWFQMIAEQMRSVAEDASFDEAVEAIVQGAEAVGLAWAVETLVEHLRAVATDPLAVLREMGDPGLEAELVEVNQAAAAPQGAEQDTAADEELDEAVWNEYVAQWQGQWDGTDESWPGFKESFVYWAPAGAKQAAQQLVEAAEAAGLSATLTPYGIPAAATARAEEPAAQTADEPDAAATISAVLEEHPEFATLGTERLQELFAAAAAELQASEQPTSS